MQLIAAAFLNICCASTQSIFELSSSLGARSVFPLLTPFSAGRAAAQWMSLWIL
jgi:hypothetical protein